MTRRRALAGLAVTALLWIAGPRCVHADNIRPAYLELEELDPGRIKVVWKLPLNQAGAADLRPSFPEAFKLSSRVQRYEAGGAVAQTWEMVCGEGGLPGARIGIEGLEATVTDAMLRIRLADGSVHRMILRPTDSFATVPAAAAADAEAARPAWLRLLDHWRYALLLPAAWLLSLTPAARRRGIILCTLALVLGSLAGHALGRLAPPGRLLGGDLPSRAEATRVLQGLLLNTYRAFMLEDDEEVYTFLGRSVVGELLHDIYLENREVLRIDREEGSLSIIDRVDVRDIESMKRLEDGRIAMVASWDVYGSVLHWEHVHYRCNSYKAELVVVPTDDYWKLGGFQLLEVERVI